MRQLTTCLTILCTLSVFAQSEPAPCSAMPAAAPCGLSVKDLDAPLQQKIAQAQERVAAARAAALDAEIDSTLIELEAARLKVAARDLYYNEIVRKTPPVTEDEYKIEYDSNHERYGAKPLDEQRARLRAVLSTKHQAARAAEYA